MAYIESENVDNEVLLDVKNLSTSFLTNSGEVKAVDDISYYIKKGEIVALVGESGCGKSVSQLSVMQLIQSPPGKILGGKVLFSGKNLLGYAPNSKEMRSIRGAVIAMIFQEPMTSLNPIITVGNQLTEVIRTHKKIGKKEAWKLAVNALSSVEIPDPERRMKNYPYEMSGGMRQRVMIATAIACNSQLIIADEPTTALDVTTQAQIMELIANVIKKYEKSLLLVTHNLGVVTRYANRIYVMYAGKIVESGTTEELMTSPKHPYTIGLLNSIPGLDDSKEKDLIPIKGSPPNLVDLPKTCTFMPRCPYANEVCKNNEFPELRKVEGHEHFIACHLNLSEVNR